jgi:4-amino-4-deoxy-L-arabinose transferase-like glycosyltransferase
VSREHAGTLILVVALLLLRGVFLTGALDPSQERVNEIVEYSRSGAARLPERPLYDREELYTATAAEALRQRTGFPLSECRFMNYGGGSLLVALLTVPIYAVFGPHYLAFKLIALLVAVAGGLLWFLTVRAWFGPRVAAGFGVLYALAPPTLLRTSLIAKGDHAEAMLLIGGVLLLATRAAFARDERHRRRWAAAAGLLAGLGVYVTYSTIPTLAGAGIAALALTRLRPRRAWVAFAIGLAVGLVPWLLSAARTGQTLQVYGESLGALRSLSEAARRAQLLVSEGFLAAYDLPGRAARALAALLWFAIVLAGWVTLVRARRRPAAVIVLAATAAYLAAFCLRAPDASSRYLAPGYPLLLIAGAALVAPRAPGAIGGGRPGLLAVGLLGVLGLLSQTVSVADSRFPALRVPLAGTDWPLLGELAGQKLRTERIRTLPATLRPHFWVGHGKFLFGFVPPPQWESAIAQAGPEARARIWEGIGLGWFESGRLPEFREQLAGLDAPDRSALRHGFARYLPTACAAIARSSGPLGVREFIEDFPEEDRATLGPPAAQAVATVMVQGLPLGGTGDRGVAAFEEAIGSGVWSRALGAALYRDASRRGLRFWTPPGGSWARALAEQVRARRGPVPLWEGVASAYERDLSLRAPDRVLAGCTAELAGVTRGLAEPIAALFYRAAGRAVGRARLDPSASAAVRAVPPDRLTAGLPEVHREAFQSGLDEADASR